MKFEKRDAYFIIVGVLFVVFISFFRFNLTGEVVWEPTTTVVNCTDSQVLALWDEIFVESSSGVMILKNGTSNCENFVAYKNSGQKTFFIIFNKGTSDGEIVYTRMGVQQKANLTKEVVAVYFNATQDSIDKFLTNMTTYSSAKAYALSSISSLEVYNWTITLSNASSIYNSEFDIGIEESFEEPEFSNAFTNSEILQTLEFDKSAAGIVGKNQSFIEFYFLNTSFYNVSSSSTVLKKNISNVTFETNSSWNYAFDINDTFTYGSGVSIGFDYTGTNNTGGLNINWTINNTKVYFKPATGYIGSKDFRLSAMSSTGTVYSNTFKVTIVENLNDPPRLKAEFEQLFVPRGGNLTVPLDMYFEDPNGDSLDYNTSEVENITISFSDEYMIITLKENFTDYETFYVYANDEDFNVGSNKIYVFEELEVETFLANDTNETFFAGDLGGGNTSFLENTSGNNSTSSSEEGKIGWIFWVIGGVLVLGLVGIGGYFLFSNSSPKPTAGPSPQVQNYLEEVNGQQSSPVKGQETTDQRLKTTEPETKK
jgi:hypothetical protein